MSQEHLPRYQHHIIDKLFPSYEIHLVAGPSGAGKSRWLIQMMVDWAKGKSILGHRSHPARWVYVSADRSQAGVQRVVDSLGIPQGEIPFIAAADHRLSMDAIIARASEMEAKVLAVEMFGSFCPGFRHADITKFMHGYRNVLREHDMTLIGTMESPKLKPRDNYENPRQRVSGVATWGHLAETIVLVEPADVKNPANGQRKIYVMPRNGESLVIQAAFVNGKLVPIQTLDNVDLSGLADENL